MKNKMILKRRYLRAVIRFKNYANSENGEKKVLMTLSVLFALLIIDLSLLTVGIIL